MKEQMKSRQLAKTIIEDLQDLLTGRLSSDRDSAIASALRENVDRIACFSDLHDYLDANILGESEKLWEELTSDIPPEGDEVKVQGACDVLNEAQSMVDEWIKQGCLKEFNDLIPNDGSSAIRVDLLLTQGD